MDGRLNRAGKKKCNSLLVVDFFREVQSAVFVAKADWPAQEYAHGLVGCGRKASIRASHTATTGVSGSATHHRTTTRTSSYASRIQSGPIPRNSPPRACVGSRRCVRPRQTPHATWRRGPRRSGTLYRSNCRDGQAYSTDEGRTMDSPNDNMCAHGRVVRPDSDMSARFMTLLSEFADGRAFHRHVAVTARPVSGSISMCTMERTSSAPAQVYLRRCS